MKEKEVLKVTHSCPLSPCSWPKHYAHIMFSGCNEGTENVVSLQLFEKGDNFPPQESAIAFSGGKTLCQ